MELLKLEGLGLPQAEIVKQLSQKAGCSQRTLYNDFETRASWQPILQSVIKPEDVLLKIMNRYEQIYRQASLHVLSSPNPFAQLGALNIMVKVNSLMFESLVLPARTLIERKPLEINEKLSVTTPFEADPKLRETLLESITKQKAEKVERDAAKGSDAPRL